MPAGPGGAADGGDAGSATYLLASDTVAAHAKDLGYESADDATAAVLRTVVGAELDGVEYERLFDFLAEAEGYENAWRVLVAEYVETGEGTGIVHQAPATAPTTRRSARPRASPSCSPSTRAACSRRSSARSPACSGRTPTSR